MLREDAFGNALYIIAEGSVEVVKNLDQPNETVLAELTALNFFGEMCIIEAVAHAASIRVVRTPTTLFEIHASDLYRLFLKFPDQYAILILNIAREMSRRLRKINAMYAEKTA